MMTNRTYVVGCDVGTGSARAAIFDATGSMQAMATEPIKMWKPKPDFVEQSSENIWQACSLSIKKAVEKAGVTTEQVVGIGFDATCSLVVLGPDDAPLSVSPTASDEQNVIVWMDHRAAGEAEKINQTGHKVLDYVGGTISPEMEMPKLLWLKKNMPDTWEKASKFFDLADFLVYKATGIDERSECTTTCKWTYLAHEKRWDDSFFETIGLQDEVENNYRRIGQKISPVGKSVGQGLKKEATQEMGLAASTAVGVGIIDAHAGGLGLLGMKDTQSNGDAFNPDEQLALIGGTSTCHMAVSKNPRFIDGVWGPYYSAMIPDLWLTEGGQSATGALVDHVIFSSNQADKLEKRAEKEGTTVYEILNQKLYQLKEDQGLTDISFLTKDLHVLPYFHGNRSPRANPSLLGGISGLKLSSTIADLALLYLATIQAIAYGTRHVIERLNDAGYTINKIMATGGGTKNEIFLKEHADISGCQIMLAEESEAVLLGSAVLGAVAAGTYASVLEAMNNMNHAGSQINPSETRELNDYHEMKYKVFKRMHDDQIAYDNIMSGKSIIKV